MTSDFIQIQTHPVISRMYGSVAEHVALLEQGCAHRATTTSRAIAQ